MEMVPSWALADQISLLSGEMSKPSDPSPTLTTVCFQSSRGGPGGGAPASVPCCGFGGGPLGARIADFSMMLTVPELMLVVTMRLPSGETEIMWVRFCPVPRIQSTLLEAGS